MDATRHRHHVLGNEIATSMVPTVVMPLTSIRDTVIGSVVAVLVAAALGAIGVRAKRLGKTARTLIELPLSKPLAADRRFRFGLWHVRDGTDDATERGPLLNETHWFEPAVDRTRLVASLRYERRLGAQFKCFADYSDMDFEEAANLLSQEETIAAVDPGGSPRSQRAWFLVGSYGTVTTSDGIRNNFVFPR